MTIVLTQRGVVPYLLQRKLLGEEAVVEGGLRVVEASRRNRNFKVTREGGASYLLKQGVGEGGRATIANEAAMYRHFQGHVEADHLARYLPRFYGYDADDGILVLELFHDARDLRAHYLRAGRFSATLAAALGTALGGVHALPLVAGPGGDGPGDGGEYIPEILSIHRPSRGIFREVSNAHLQMVRIIQHAPEFGQRLDALRAGWRWEALIHHDLKWDNCLVAAPDGSARRRHLKIVDWELACPGDPCWDVASVFGDYLNAWLMSIPVTGDNPPDHFMSLARYPLERMQPAVGAFWHAYVRRMGFDEATAADRLLRSVNYSAARLLQAGVEQAQFAIRLTGNFICLLQLSLNILRRPRQAAAALLGITEREVRAA